MGIKSFLVLILALLLNQADGQQKKQLPLRQPSIIFFLVDDMGWQDTSVPFWKEKTLLNGKYQTPHMERLAKTGMKFTQAYASSVCSPTRCSLISGMNAARHRVTSWTLARNASNDASDYGLTFPLWNVNGVQPVDSIERSTYITPLPALLRKNGYYTIHVGKAHFGAQSTPGANPTSFGFDVNIAGHPSGGPASYQGLDRFGNDQNGLAKSVWSVPGLEKYHDKDVNLTEALTLEAKLAMDTALAAGKPFYLYMSHDAVHVPLQPQKPYYQKYKGLGYTEQQAVYASMIEGMDKSLGDLMDYVKQKGIEKNTVIIFLSDNGGYSASGKVRGGESHTHNKPLNSGKGSAYEGGIRVPMMVKWPGKVTAGSLSAEYLIAEDFFPSILELAAVKKYNTVQHVDGISFLAALLGKKSADQKRELVWHFPNKWGETGPGIGPTSTIRRGDWKLIYYYDNQIAELFNIASDIGEQTNLASKHPQIANEMSKRLSQRLRAMNAQLPIERASGLPVSWPDGKIMNQ